MSILELRMAEADIEVSEKKLAGYAARFDATATINDPRRGTFTEAIARGAFTKSLGSGRDILCLVDHDPGRLLGRTRSGTLRLYEDTRGLGFEVSLAGTQLARDIHAMAERRDIGGASFQFIPRPRGEEWRGKHRVLTDVELFEVSIVQSHPAYPQTEVQARARNLDGTLRNVDRVRRFIQTVRS